MADQNRTATHFVNLLNELQAHPYRFHFYEAVRRLDCASRDRPRSGCARRPADEAVRFGQHVALTFPPAMLAKVVRKEGFAPRVFVRFFGLLGPNGPLPLHLTEYAHERIHHHDDETFARFLDIFHHRLLTFFYRSWASAQPAVNFDRPESDRFSTYVASMIGLGMPSLRNRDAMPDETKLHYCGHLANGTRHAEGLEVLLSDFFRLPVRIQEFVGQWFELPADCRCQLGVSPRTATLGESAMIGSHFWDCQQKFRVVIGPMTLDDYRRLLPGGENMERLMAIVRNYAGDEWDWDVKLILNRDEIPPMALGQSGRLGWTDWVHADPPTRDGDDLELDVFVEPGELEWRVADQRWQAGSLGALGI